LKIPLSTKLDHVRQERGNLDPTVQRLGLWRARAPFQHSLNLIDINTLWYSPEADNFDLPIDVNVQDHIEAIGRTMLDEAYKSLGADADAKLEEFLAAETWQERLKVCKWLLRRIKKINKIAPNMDKEIFYHPIRLSPKAIGVFPEINVQPTCLGYSILLASFIEKTGVQYMHAGIAATASNEARRAQNIMIDRIAGLSIDTKKNLPPELVHRFVEAVMANLDTLDEHRGFHAGLLVNLGEDMWFQMDPNFDKNMLYHPKAGNKMENAYGYLDELKDRARGLEFMLVNRAGMYPHYFHDKTFRALIENIVLPEEAEEFLLSLEPQTALSEINTKLFDRLYNPAEVDNELFVQDLVLEFCKNLGADYHEYMHLTVMEAIEQYVFPDSENGDISKCIERCKTDRNYLRRRAEDLQFIPFLTLLKLQTDLVEEIVEGSLNSPHTVTEVGLPAYRIGACVLSDFAVYCQDDLPLSFWMSHWPSQVSFADHITDLESEAQQELSVQVAETIDDGLLHYLTIDTIIDDVLEQGGDVGVTSRETE
jgi:hypothetical protein